MLEDMLNGPRSANGVPEDFSGSAGGFSACVGALMVVILGGRTSGYAFGWFNATSAADEWAALMMSSQAAGKKEPRMRRWRGAIRARTRDTP